MLQLRGGWADGCYGDKIERRLTWTRRLSLYNKMGQWVPSFPADTTNVPSDPMTYPNNPDDPTEPLTPGPENETDPGDPDNPRLPYVPGFTPQGPDGEPLDQLIQESVCGYIGHQLRYK
ncbi:MAG: hypothetical protein ACLT1C_02950 [Weissella confusa]